MGLFDLKPKEPETVAQRVSYFPLKNAKAARQLGNHKAVMAAFHELVDDPTAQPTQGQIFQVDRGMSTQYGTVPPGEPGVVVRSHEEELAYQVAVPTRASFLDNVTHLMVEVHLPEAEGTQSNFSEKTMAIGHAVMKLTNGTINEPGGNQ